MLVLTRKAEQSVLIGELGNIKVTVISTENGIVRLGFDAPPHIPVHREELFKKIQQQGHKERDKKAISA